MASTSDKQRRSQAERLFVAAIDFGTTYSGFAFLSRHYFQENPMKIDSNVNENWVGGSDLLSLKTPTVLLLNKQKAFVAFGYEAEDKYSNLAAEDEHEGYYYFRRFKMKLYKTYLHRDTLIEDENGKRLDALTVFSRSIKYLYDTFMECVKKKIADNVTESDIEWVLTVPAIWSDGAKQFMREAAEQAGIKTKLTIALEPEAASLFCMHIPVQRSKTPGPGETITSFQTGTKYMVVDAGGGTVDITVHQVVEGRKLKELMHASGGAWGGTRVDAAFEKFLDELFGKDVMDTFKSDYPEDWIEVMRKFEKKKRSITMNKEGKETLDVPINLVNVFKDIKKTDISNVLDGNTKFAAKIKAARGKFRIDCDLMRSWFDESCTSIVEHIRDLFRKPRCTAVNTILLVGGFSESPMLQQAIQMNFKERKVIVPDDASLVVMKGAALFGHDPLQIVERVAKVTYGIRMYQDFDPKIHSQSKREIIQGKAKCKDCFSIHVKKDDVLKVDQPQQRQRYTPLEEDQITLQFDVFTSTKENPKYTDKEEGSKYVGQLEVGIPGFGKDRAVWVSMTYGGTEVTVTGVNEKTKEETSSKLDFMHYQN